MLFKVNPGFWNCASCGTINPRRQVILPQLKFCSTNVPSVLACNLLMCSLGFERDCTMFCNLSYSKRACFVLLVGEVAWLSVRDTKCSSLGEFWMSGQRHSAHLKSVVLPSCFRSEITSNCEGESRTFYSYSPSSFMLVFFFFEAKGVWIRIRSTLCFSPFSFLSYTIDLRLVPCSSEIGIRVHPHSCVFGYYKAVTPITNWMRNAHVQFGLKTTFYLY